MTVRSIEAIVHEALDNAVDNGYEPCCNNSAVVCDLASFCSELEEVPTNLIEPHVASWRTKNS